MSDSKKLQRLKKKHFPFKPFMVSSFLCERHHLGKLYEHEHLRCLNQHVTVTKLLP